MVPKTLFEIISQSALIYVDAPAVTSRAHDVDHPFARLSHEGLRDAVSRFAVWMHTEMHVAQGDNVAILATNSVEWLVAYFAIAALGAVSVPVHPKVSFDQLQYVVARTQPKLVLCSRDTQAPAHGALAAAVVDSPVIDLDTVATLIEDTPPASHEDLAFWAPRPTDRASILWTSGTTDFLKGVVLTHQNLCVNLDAFRNAVPLASSERLFSMLPLAHIFELNVGALTPLSQGASITYPAPEEDLVETFFEVAPTTIIAVPRLLEKLVAWGEVRLEHLAPLQLIISGGASLPVDLARRFVAMKVQVLQGYGLTETGPVISVNRRWNDRLGSVGKPLRDTEVRIVEGELQTRGPCVSPGYLSFEETLESRGEGSDLRPDSDSDDGEHPWFKTGDLVMLDDDGFIYIIGRKKEIIVLSTGEKIAPLAIEMRLESLPQISQAMVVGEGRKHIAALLTLDDPLYMTQKGAPTRLRTDISAALANLPANHQVRTYIVLSHPFSIEAGELTPTLKLRRDEIERKYASQIDDLYNRT